MTDDLEERLSEALEQRGRVDQIEVHQVLDSVVLPGRRLSSGGLARLVAVVLVGGLTVGALAIGLSNRGVGVTRATQSGPVTASKTDGTFTLNVTADHGTYSPTDAITVHTTLTYTGTPTTTEVYGSGSGLVGFGVQQDGKEPIGGVMTDDLRPYAFVSGIPVDYPYAKSVGYVPGESGASFAEQYFRDPLLHLPTGTWHIHAYFNGSIGAAAPSIHQLDVSVTVVVTDDQAVPSPSVAPTQAPKSPTSTDPVVDPAAPVSASVTDGMFTLKVTAEHGSYAAGKAITIHTTLTYTGDPAHVVVAGSGSGLVIFGVEQEGGDSVIGVASADCHQYDFTSGEAVDYPFAKSGGYVPGASGAGFAEQYLNDPLLHLPAGTWRIHAWFTGYIGGCSQSTRHQFETSVPVVITDGSAVPPDTTVTSPAILPAPLPDPSALLSDPRVQGCQGGGLPGILSVFEVSRARDLFHYVPDFAVAPEVRSDEPALVVVDPGPAAQ